MAEIDTIDVTQAMNSRLIRKIERISHNLFSVVLVDGRQGSGTTVGEAYDKASRDDAPNVLLVP